MLGRREPGSGPAWPECARGAPGAWPGRRLLPRPAAAPRTRRRTRGRHHPDRRLGHAAAPSDPQPAGSLVYQLLTGQRSGRPVSWCSWPTSPVSYAPGPPIPGPSSASTPSRSPRRSSAAGRTARSPGRSSTTSASRRPACLAGPAMTYVREQLRGRLDRPDHSHAPALVASHQRSPIRRPVPVTNNRLTTRDAVVPEAADGQSADGSGSLQLSSTSSRPALPVGNDTSVTGERPHPRRSVIPFSTVGRGYSDHADQPPPR